ncbi:alpha/beta-hydrolase [Aspergillus sclerotioniger CBS 115572]|uniref:Alpha/beta-hydrolase n=1 Tax=Aspergillus sclerotioniger CBS 115572 TaxID=1450535 RepID=A0A317WQU0_9EURO|nr:alpha/beta-hydrolase [Aspergillus sclerotioniger CBS 115572]PWY88874.1 alpha/beta-hydrolase [Aspergillus sclerotioniger CBS 115572]
MSSQSPPTIVLVHGAWHTPTAYQPFISALKAQGFTVHAPLLPSSAQSLNPSQSQHQDKPASLPEDIACIRNLISTLANQGHRILPLFHSYGGVVGTDAITRDLTLPDRQSRGLPGGVIHLVYICAYMLLPGGSVVKTIQEGGVENPAETIVDVGDDRFMYPKDPIAQMYNMVERGVAESVVGGLVRFPFEACDMESVGEAWRFVPVTYVVTGSDRMVWREWQVGMVGRVREHGGDVRMVELDSCHSPFLSKRGELVGVVVGAARDERNA